MTYVLTHDVSSDVASLHTCHLSALLLPRPSPLHTPDDTLAYHQAATDAAAELLDYPPKVDVAQTVLGALDANAPLTDARERLSAVEAMMEAYHAYEPCFVHDTDADIAAKVAAGEGSSNSTKFAHWAFDLAKRTSCNNLVVFGGSGWLAGLINELGESLSDDERDCILPLLALNEDVVDDAGKTVKLPLMPMPADARFVRIVRRMDDGEERRRSVVCPRASDKDEHAYGELCEAALQLNPKRPEGTSRDEWLRGMLAAGWCCSY